MSTLLPGPFGPSLSQLANAVMQELGVLDTGQSVSAEDQDIFLDRFYPKLEVLNARDVCYIDPDNISNAEYLPIVKIMAWELASAFNVTDPTKLALLKEAGAENGMAEQALKDIVRLRTPRQTMRCEVFNRPWAGRRWKYMKSKALFKRRGPIC